MKMEILLFSDHLLKVKIETSFLSNDFWEHNPQVHLHFSEQMVRCIVFDETHIQICILEKLKMKIKR